MPAHAKRNAHRTALQTALRSTSAIVCLSMASMQVQAQSVIGEPLSLLRQEAEHTRFAITVQYADLLELTYNQIVRDIRSWGAQSGHEATLTHMATNDVMPNGVFRRIDTEELTRWGIRARLCDDQLIVYYADNNFKSGITPTQIRHSQKERMHRNGEVIEATRKAPLGWIDQTQLVLQGGERVTIPTCFDTDYAGPLPRGGVAFIGPVRPDNLYAKDNEWAEHRRDVCTAPQVGAGRYMRRIRYEPVDHRGLRPTDDMGNFIWPNTYGPWELHRNNCYDAREREYMDASTRCTRTFMGKESETPALYRWKMKEIQDPSDPFKVVWVVVDPDGSVVANPRGELVQSLCDNPPPAPTVSTNVAQAQETRTQDCQTIYPNPPFLPSIGYRDGEYIEERTKSTFTQVYDFARDPIEIVSYSAWVVQSDTCSRPLVRAEEWEYATQACPAGRLGELSGRRTRQDEMIDYAKDGNTNILTIPTSNVLFGDWESVENLCHTTNQINVTESRALGCGYKKLGYIAQERGKNSVTTYYDDPLQRYREGTTVTYSSWRTVANTCIKVCEGRAEPPNCAYQSSAASLGWTGGGDGDPTSVDVDGDGIGDYGSEAAAEAAGHTNGVSVDGTCGACNGPSNDNGPNAGDGGGDGPGGACVLCTAMNARYGFGSFRQTLWAKHAEEHLTPFHRTGYHMMALPLIRYAYGRNAFGSNMLRKSMEHIARERTADIWAEQRGTKRRILGRFYRGVFEPLSYYLGRLAKGRTIAGVKDVPALVTRTTTKGSFS